MAYGIGLTLDDALEAKVRKVWHQFEVAGIGKTPGQFNEPPHITFSVFPSGDPSALVELVDATPITDTRITLIPFGAFLGEKRVLYYNAVLSQGLLEAHSKHFEIARERAMDEQASNKPGSTLFHCTMAVEIEEADFVRGIDICVANTEVLEGRAHSLELFKFFPVQFIHRRKITKD